MHAPVLQGIVKLEPGKALEVMVGGAQRRAVLDSDGGQMGIIGQIAGGTVIAQQPGQDQPMSFAPG